jgi:hypothetical protein
MLSDDRKHSVVDCVEDRSVLGDDMVAEEKALVRKIDLFLMPTIWLMYLLSYMDRTNIGKIWYFAVAVVRANRVAGNAKVAGMTDDLGMDSNDYSVALVVVSVILQNCN